MQVSWTSELLKTYIGQWLNFSVSQFSWVIKWIHWRAWKVLSPVHAAGAQQVLGRGLLFLPLSSPELGPSCSSRLKGLPAIQKYNLPIAGPSHSCSPHPVHYQLLFILHVKCLLNSCPPYPSVANVQIQLTRIVCRMSFLVKLFASSLSPPKSRPWIQPLRLSPTGLTGVYAHVSHPWGWSMPLWRQVGR